VSPALTATLGVCAVTTTSRISATLTLTVFEVAVVLTPPTEYVTSAVFWISVPASAPAALASGDAMPNATIVATTASERTDCKTITPRFS
jgi:hypothetical protein